MKLKIFKYYFIILTFIISGFGLYQDSTTTMLTKLDQIFDADHIKVTIPHHGGYAASFIGNGIMKINLQKKDSTYLIKYKDAIDRRQLEFTIDKNEYKKLKELFIQLIEIHNPHKKLSGNCLSIDQNFILQSSQQSLTIKPEQGWPESDCLINWIYGKELKN